MADFLTERNGVVCPSCFFTIDLTQVKTDEYPKMVKALSRFFGRVDWFRVTCPHCDKQNTHLYSNVKPLSDLKDKLNALNKEQEKDTPQFREWKNGN